MRLSRRDLLAAVSVVAVMSATQAAFAEDRAPPGEAPEEAEVARSIDMGGLVFPLFDEKGLEPMSPELTSFLQECDLVKFARFEPSQDELKSLLESALRFIDETAPHDNTTGAPGRTPDLAPSPQ